MKIHALSSTVLLVAALLLSACGDSASTSTDGIAAAGQALHGKAPDRAEHGVWFEDAAASSGLDFVHQWGHQDVHWMPEIMAGGAALFDMDGDGDLDAYLVQSGFLMPGERQQPGNQLYRNLGGGEVGRLRFENISEAAGDAAHTGYGMGVAVGDVDGDGRVDLYVTNVGPDVLLRNLGDGRFADITGQAGLGSPAWGASAAFLDYDRDGDLDLFVTTYLDWSPSRELDCYNARGWQVYCSPQSYEAPLPDLLYRNDGDGRFTDVSAATGISQKAGNGLGVVSSDFDNDGWPDLFVANDGTPDHLWLNRRDGTFREDGAFAGCAFDLDGRPKAGMGVTVGDYDNDGDSDLLVCNLRQESDSLYRNQGGLFSDVTAALGLGSTSVPFTRFGIGWVDFDNDGQLDLYQANGRVTRHSEAMRSDDPHAEPNLLFRGGPEGYREIHPRGGTGSSPLIATSRAAAFGDLDGDGGIDILVVNSHAPPQVLRNVVPGRGQWILLSLLDRHGAPALGARLSARIGERPVVQEVRSAYSYQAANDPRLHIGLGDADRLTGVRVRWADGSESEHGTLTGGQVVTLRQGS